jgi:predicted AlkP superfamily phosphohydrolase/phosphomutase
VAAGEEYQRVCDDLIAALGALVNPATGRPAVRAVVRSDEAFPGPRRAFLPDLVVLWNGEAAIDAVVSEAAGTVAGASPDGRPGTHTAPGFLLRAGAGSVHERGDRGHVRDLAPELLEHFGVAVPEHMRATPGRARAVAQGGMS